MKAQFVISTRVKGIPYYCSQKMIINHIASHFDNIDFEMLLETLML